jgi:hypothetical protein
LRGIASCLSLVAALLLAACKAADDGGSDLRISLLFTPPTGGTDNVVWIAGSGRSGGRLLVDVVVRDISFEFDGFNVEVLFDPLVAEVESLASGGVLQACTSLPVLGADNIASGNANATGTLLFSEAISGASPPPCTVAGTTTLARIVFRPRGRGDASLPFVPYNGNPSSPSGSRLYRRVPVNPDVGATFFDSLALIKVRH